MKTIILRTHKRTKSNSFSDALFRTLTVARRELLSKFSNETDKTDNCQKGPFVHRLFSSLGCASARKLRLGRKRRTFWP
jgi:hypothetical protein